MLPASKLHVGMFSMWNVSKLDYKKDGIDPELSSVSVNALSARFGPTIPTIPQSRH